MNKPVIVVRANDAYDEWFDDAQRIHFVFRRIGKLVLGTAQHPRITVHASAKDKEMTKRLLLRKLRYHLHSGWEYTHV